MIGQHGYIFGQRALTGGTNVMQYLTLALFFILAVWIQAVDIEVWPLFPLSESDREQCRSEIYCQGPLLATVQSSDLFIDCKRFVDMPGKYSEDIIVKNFAKLPKNASKDAVMGFVTDNFERPGHDLRVVVPGDWIEEPPSIKKIKNHRLREFALAVHSKWKALVRMVDPEKTCQECASSVLKLPHPFVVPGGRFRELYYWDTFWILEGLYVSGMCETAHMNIKNFQWMIKTYGFIPNGSRTYYLNRSHPPLFTMMVRRYMDQCVPLKEQSQYIKEILPYLDQEYMFWDKFRSVKLMNPTDPKRPFRMSRYHADTNLPRPESFLQDVLSAQTNGLSTDARKRLFQQIATGAESGWDFSSRWFNGSATNFTSIVTSNIIPVDLNSIMYRNEMILADFHDLGGTPASSKRYGERAQNRLEGIKTYLWKKDEWIDYDFVRKVSMNSEKTFVVSNLAALWYGAFSAAELSPTAIERMLQKYWHVLWGYPGGIPIGEVSSGQQWDFPNVWAPIQLHFINVFEALASKLPDGGAFWKRRAVDVAQKLINTTYCGYHNYKQFFEKYHAQVVGEPGGGGEYIVQDGFGWTNGVILTVLDRGREETDQETGQEEVAFRKRERTKSIASWIDQHPFLSLSILIFVFLLLSFLVTLIKVAPYDPVGSRSMSGILRQPTPALLTPHIGDDPAILV
ncbi:Trehalase [Paramicrosporidium saccamoebae]|uniref:Trehalase n=1 Tax=Paramicrosporidium saccamoebae TaxID=1246581 RepID=A0A2H9TI58_9FUNG|nr:Trehalase [Paramicrosporidium saccamoebae]